MKSFKDIILEREAIEAQKKPSIKERILQQVEIIKENRHRPGDFTYAAAESYFVTNCEKLNEIEKAVAEIEYLLSLSTCPECGEEFSPENGKNGYCNSCIEFAILD